MLLRYLPNLYKHHYTDTLFILIEYLCPCLCLGLFMWYLHDLFFIYIFIFIIINFIISRKRALLFFIDTLQNIPLAFGYFFANFSLMLLEKLCLLKTRVNTRICISYFFLKILYKAVITNKEVFTSNILQPNKIHFEHLWCFFCHYSELI